MNLCHQSQNLGGHARARAVRGGVLMCGVALGFTLLASELGMTRKLGWVVALPVALGAYLLISGILGICVYHGIQGLRATDYGDEAVLDPQRRGQLKLRALVAATASLAIAIAVAAALVTAG